MWIELAVVDVLGTTIEDDGIAADALAATLNELDLAVDYEELRLLAGLPVVDSLVEVFRRRDRQPTAAELASAAVRVEERIAHDLATVGASMIHGAADAFAVLRARGARVVLTTSLSRRLLEEVLFRAGIRAGRDVDAAIASDDCLRGRPFGDAIDAAMAFARVVDTRRVCKVGSTVADMREGRRARAGVRVGVASGAATRVELERAGATFVLPSVASLPLVLFGAEAPRRSAGATREAAAMAVA